ncbi:MAG: 2-amino-4-hydroxy-6-hydroxymethyldihydropteridine diphosphokinase [Candidatus Marinimicrobia bacterium]|nr:2-amino-4-hydroxy-6-hydroxymethyldihydropteridine diphosphokinase [Candidatus Neomarinimicrobiota bacterium]
MSKAYIGIGTNVGNKLDNIKLALQHIDHIQTTELTGVSSIFETEPLYYYEQDYFYNAVAEIKTELDPVVLLQKLKEIEKQMGRDFKVEKNGPRLIDLDIEFFEDIVVETNNLEIPHSRIYERMFVLKPMYELNKNFKCSKTGKTIELLLQECKDDSKIEKIANLDISSLKKNKREY